ncbi:MAG: UvrD-helicase domain-containing protein, partial [Planctomycetia bacterium]
LRTAMHTFLHDEERSCRETGRRPLALEAAIGVEPAAEGTPFDCREPVVVSLAPGETIKLRGRIDRIDVRDDGDGGQAYALWDYKSGSGYGFPAMAADDPFNGGRKLQHGLYVVMLRTRLADPECPVGGGEVERFGYFFPTRAGKGRRLEWTAAQLADCTALVRRLAEIARQGVFLPTDDPADCAFCDFAAVCGDAARVTRAAARMVGGSQPLRDLFGELRRDRQQRAAPAIRRPHEAPLALTPHPPAPVPPPDEPVRQRIRADLGTTLLVEAAAGTGKTTCMVDRMLALVRTGAARPEGIVAVTFTKKAAGELRRRFREKLQRAALEASDPVEQARLMAALERVDSMVIGTIHSFAGRLLRERPLEAGVDPGFRELDDSADRLLRRQAWREFVSAAPTDHPQLLADLDAVGLRLGDLSRLFAERFATYGDVEDWPAPATPPPDVTAVVAAVEAFAARIEAEVFPGPAERGTDELMNSLEQFARMVRRCDTSSVVAVMDLLQELDRTPKVTQMAWPGAGDDAKERKAAQKAAALGWQAAWEQLRDMVARPALWQWRAHRYPVAIAALQKALAVYDRLRAERGGLSFQDLLCKAARLLVGQPDVRRSFRARYTHLLVDEFQDTDPVQAEMLLLLTATDPDERDWRKCVPAPGSLFVVGDPKQSLYRFRRADIVTYTAVRDIIAANGDVLALTTNFRSRGDLVSWANDVFTSQFPPQATVESPSFTPSTSGRREAPPTGGEQGWLTGIRTLRFVRGGTAGDLWAEQEAREIASFIRRAIDAGMAVPRTLDEAARGLTTACRPGDFLLVARERKHLGIYAAALHAVGLPVDVTGTLGEDHAEPLRELRTCLAALADPDDPVALLALVRGVVFGFSDAELFAYKMAGGRFTGGIDVPAGLDAALAARFAAARDAVIRWRAWLRQLPVAATVERIIDDAGLFLIAAVADGEAGPRGRAVAGLVLKYVERLRTDRAEVVSIHDCLDLLDDMVDGATRAEFDPLTIDAPSTDCVRVMNLHKAKGLEAPVVFLVDFQKRKVGDDVTDGPFLHVDRTHARTTGRLAVTRAVGWSQRIVAAPPGWEDHCRRERAFEQAEQIRLDYVAATRPGSCLIVSLFEKCEKGKKDEPDTFTAEGAWERFGGFLVSAADLPTLTAGVASPAPLPAAIPPAALAAAIRTRIAACVQPTFARIAPRELLTEPAEGIRFTGDGLGEPWGRAIHRLLELAAHDPDLDLRAAAATVLSGEAVSLVHLGRAVETVQEVFASAVWQRAQASPARFVEVPFAVQVRAEDLPEKVRKLAGDGAPLPTVVRGVIDLVFAEAAPGAWTVVDWKTDAVTKASEKLLEDHYRPQVELYAECWRLLAPYNHSPHECFSRGTS